MKKFRNAFTNKTKMFILNNPHNPTGKVFSYSELEEICQILSDYPNVIILSDDVYEHIYFDDFKINKVANFENMFNRTLTVSSSGKTFTVTGWKTGWAIGPEELIEKMALV